MNELHQVARQPELASQACFNAGPASLRICLKRGWSCHSFSMSGSRGCRIWNPARLDTFTSKRACQGRIMSRGSNADGAGNREVELKLEVMPAALPALRQAISIMTGRGQGSNTQTLITTYFDTDDLALEARGALLRVRRQGGRRIQSVKVMPAGGSAGIFDRSEWEAEIDGDGPDLALVRETPLKGLVSRKRFRRALKPVFTTAVQRSTHALRRNGATVELALDEATIQAGAATGRFCELELELISGHRATLYDIARDLIESQPLHVGVESKAERGYALLQDSLDHAVKADTLRLLPDLSAADGFRTVAHSCMRHFRRNEGLVVAHRTAEALHQARVALRRLRSALSLFKAMVADEALEAIKEDLRWLSAPLGKARNHDVFLKRLDRLAPAIGGKDAEALIPPLRAAREHAYDEVIATLRAERCRRLMLTLIEWLDLGPWTRPGTDEARAILDMPLDAFAARILDERYRKVKKRGKRLRTLEPEPRHRLRIQAKKLRYAVEFFGPAVFGGRKAAHRHAALLDALEEMQDCLGTLNDIATGRALAAGLAQSRDSAFVAGRLAGQEETREPDLLAAAARAHRRFLRVERFWR
ncbi:CHAD domain-containing protein [Vineibacter terrae]|uniref:CYTH and CHAD domain-containing protein n=1 Tax=Vineibacter terrae TaxID=2586908 RepID=UPI002E371C1A|nr:CHAD domain-containing protein [Vineibacter terrae]HEX2889775.1 CHAD domain-containing protein [Vineibacter terrae]